MSDETEYGEEPDVEEGEESLEEAEVPELDDDDDIEDDEALDDLTEDNPPQTEDSGGRPGMPYTEEPDHG